MTRLRAEGWVVYRAAGSHGCADLVALSAGRTPMLVQVKSSAQGPYEHFRPDERVALCAEATQAGAEAVLCHWPAHRSMRLLGSDEWPQV